ncbi:MAG: gliding motility-associated C-terminal domain-containing protein [Bacteroidetes bacterium]|nr:gliding motility-associated C-terminal domain-containing protein [Bacteroidota bacterium]
MNVFKNMFVFNAQSTVMKMAMLCVFLFYNLLFGQVNNNLINNSSFENLNSCPDNLGQIGKVDYWFNGYQFGSPDLYSLCASSTLVLVPLNVNGYQNARTGTNYIGIGAYLKEFTAREYIETQLKQTLKANSQYCITYYVSLGDHSSFAVANIGAYFSSSVLSGSSFTVQYYWPPHVESNTLSPITDSINWTKVQGVHFAQGGENFVTFGNFRDDIQTNKVQVKPLYNPNVSGNGAYYYIDDISVVEINPAKAYSTKTIAVCANTTLTLGTDSTFDATYQWQPPTGLSCTNCPNPIVTVTTSKKYYLTKQQCSATTKDSVYIQIYTPTLTAKAGNYKTICLNDTVKLGVNDTTAFTSYVWSPVMGLSCTNCPQPFASPFITTTYTLNKTECSLNTSDTVTIHVETCEILIPDIFTPNNDNVNDEWKIKLPNGFKLKTVAVYNRWGTLVYNIDDALLNSENSKIRVVRWDGRTTGGIECSDGVYFYVLHYTNKTGELQRKKGNVTLIR